MGARHSESETGFRPSPGAVRVAAAAVILLVALVLVTLIVLVLQLLTALLLFRGLALVGVRRGARAGARVRLLILRSLVLLILLLILLLVLLLVALLLGLLLSLLLLVLDAFLVLVGGVVGLVARLLLVTGLILVTRLVLVVGLVLVVRLVLVRLVLAGVGGGLTGGDSLFRFLVGGRGVSVGAGGSLRVTLNLDGERGIRRRRARVGQAGPR